MKLYTVQTQNARQVCIRRTGGLLLPLSQLGLGYPDMNALLRGVSAKELELLRRESITPGPGLSPEEVTLLAPIPEPMQDVICLGMNYSKHKTEAEQFDREAFTRSRGSAVYFSKRATYCPGPGAPIPGHFDLVDSLDYEAELAVILGKDAKNVAEADAFDYVFGYTIVNDVSARNLQTGHKQWYFGKGLDGFTPMGPCIVTKDEFETPPRAAIRTWVNGQLRQDAFTDELIFGIPYIISQLSRGMTLKAGTIIATGTPAGVGMGFDPPKFLRPGDVVRCEIAGIGVLENPVQ